MVIEDQFKAQARLFKVLMHPVRLAILEVLRDGERCVCHMEALFGQRQAYISQQLMMLREAGLLLDRREGARIYYRVVKPEVFALVDTASRLLGISPAVDIPDNLEACPCPQCNPPQGLD